MKMRPIDVLNNLKGHVLWPQSYHLSEDEAAVCIEALQRQSTGEWKKSTFSNEKYVCSVCGGACWYYDYEGTVSKSNFCPNCGARMNKADKEGD